MKYQIKCLMIYGIILFLMAGCTSTPQLNETFNSSSESCTETTIQETPTTSEEVTEPTTESVESSSTTSPELPTTSPEPPLTETTEPSSAPETIPPTDPTVESTVPPETDPTIPSTEVTPTEPSTAPSNPGGEYIGSLYTRSELEAMDSKNQGYGPGFSCDKYNRPYGAMDLQKKYQKYDTWFIGPNDATIYLTFDLGWENGNLTNEMLDTMKEKNVKAVFFVLHEYCVANPDIIRRIIDEGHIIGSHAYRHKTLANMSIDKIAREITRLHEYMLEEFGYEMTLFRPPSGEFSEQVLAIAHSLGYRTVQWSYAYVDWLADNQPDVQKSYQKLMNAAHNGCIYLLHTVSTTNAAILGDLIDGLRAEGYTFSLFTDDISA